jgi:hypothetical protein
MRLLPSLAGIVTFSVVSFGGITFSVFLVVQLVGRGEKNRRKNLKYVDGVRLKYDCEISASKKSRPQTRLKSVVTPYKLHVRERKPGRMWKIKRKTTKKEQAEEKI